MTILRSMYSAAGGLSAHGNAMNVVSDNIANVNTVGYKAGRGRFSDVLGSTIAASSINDMSGQGSRMAGVDQLFAQGALLATGVSTDLAIEGDGFFAVSGAYQGIDGTFFSRDGQFRLNEQGVLVNAAGLAVQGYAADANGTIGTLMGDVTIPPGTTVPPVATTAAQVYANLDPASTPPAAWDPANPAGTSNFSTSMAVYDSLGQSHNVTMYFRHSGAGAWEWHAMVDGGELAGGTAGVQTEIADGTLTFDTNGQLDTETTNASGADFLNATAGQTITFDFGDSITTDGGTGLTGSTGFATPSTLTFQTQDGFSSGALAGVTVNQDGSVTGTFTNGVRRTLGQVVLARFQNNQGLVRGGNGLFVATEASGNPLYGAPGTGGRGSVASEALEQSNVDLGEEFINMIAYQRGFQANSRAVQTADEMLAELNTLKR